LHAQRDRTNPFYLQVGFFEPHRRFSDNGIQPDDSLGVTVPPWLVDDDGAREEFAGYQGAIHSLDNAVGEILAALEENGLRENTVVVFTADHGMPFPRAKCSVYDPGLQTPCIMRWPAGGLTGGTVHDAIISNIDYLPTWLDLLSLPTPAAVQGVEVQQSWDKSGGELRYRSGAPALDS